MGALPSLRRVRLQGTGRNPGGRQPDSGNIAGLQDPKRLTTWTPVLRLCDPKWTLQQEFKHQRARLRPSDGGGTEETSDATEGAALSK